jgi:hypothetical protein
LLLLIAGMIVITTSNAGINQSNVITDSTGIRVIFNDADLYFNASNGGEITEYYDLSIDPSRSRNLANITLGGDFRNLWPLFASGIYYQYADFFPLPDYATGGDSNAKVTLIEEKGNIVIYTSSKMANHKGLIAKDSEGFPVYINTTWTFDKNTGFIFVERTFGIKSTFNLPAGWRLYSFYMTRTTGFDHNGTYYLFNSTHVNTTIVNHDTYQNRYSSYSVFPMGANYISGIAAPFSNTNIGGDGGHNMIVTYYNGLVDIKEWKCDCFNVGPQYVFSEWGPAHQFNRSTNFTTHTYHAIIHFTHQSINANNVVNYARYAESIYPFIEVNLTTDKEVYHLGDSYKISVSGVPKKNLTNVALNLIATNDRGVYLEKTFKQYSYTKGENFSYLLFKEKISPYEPVGNRTFTLQFVSETGSIIALNRTKILIK